MNFIANKYNQKDIYKFLRQATNKTHAQLAKELNKTEDWSKSIESGRLNIKFKDIIEICNKNNIKIIFNNDND